METGDKGHYITYEPAENYPNEILEYNDNQVTKKQMNVEGIAETLSMALYSPTITKVDEWTDTKANTGENTGNNAGASNNTNAEGDTNTKDDATTSDGGGNGEVSPKGKEAKKQRKMKTRKDDTNRAEQWPRKGEKRTHPRNEWPNAEPTRNEEMKKDIITYTKTSVGNKDTMDQPQGKILRAVEGELHIEGIMNITAGEAPERGEWWSERKIDDKFGASKMTKQEFLKNRSTWINIPKGERENYEHLATLVVEECGKKEEELCKRSLGKEGKNRPRAKSEKKGKKKKKTTKHNPRKIDYNNWHFTNPTRIVMISEQAHESGNEYDGDSSQKNTQVQEIARLTQKTRTDNTTRKQGEASKSEITPRKIRLTMVQTNRAPATDWRSIEEKLKKIEGWDVKMGTQ